MGCVNQLLHVPVKFPPGNVRDVLKGGGQHSLQVVNNTINRLSLGGAKTVTWNVTITALLVTRMNCKKTFLCFKRHK